MQDADGPFTGDTIAGLECVRTRRLTMGKQTENFEHALAEHLGVAHVVMVNSGSSASLLAFSALRMLREDLKLIAVPAICWPTTLWSALLAGFEVRVVDVDSATFNIETAPQCDALLSVHVLGNACNVKHDVLIEDACEALGTVCSDGKQAGTRGLMGLFSFYWSHHMITIEGGAVATNDDDVYRELVMQRGHGWTRNLPFHDRLRAETASRDLGSDFLFQSVGYNVRPTEISAELGIMQIEKLAGWLDRREAIAHQFRNACSLRGYRVNSRRHSWFAYPIRCLWHERQSWITKMRLYGIPHRTLLGGNVTEQPFFKRIAGRWPVTHSELPFAQSAGASLYTPINPWMTDHEVDRICGVLRS